MLITLENRNYGRFNYEVTFSSICYHGVVVVEAPFIYGVIASHAKFNISISVQISPEELLSSPYLGVDYATGSLNFTSSTTLQGTVTILKILKKRVTLHSSCNISVFPRSRTIDSSCNSDVNH
ncbi:uncharacterized protein LOC143892140 [Tasmannia lanceolata]|uniref:uncharacterized protein LOC143892140 n=1 Tax=Tasmannia lanceolata TaxID=3420 RepID=UPI0040639EF4